MGTKAVRMELIVSKWGNSLAVCLPAEAAKRMGVGEGNTAGPVAIRDGIPKQMSVDHESVHDKP